MYNYDILIKYFPCSLVDFSELKLIITSSIKLKLPNAKLHLNLNPYFY